jgi:hypothetical protein
MQTAGELGQWVIDLVDRRLAQIAAILGVHYLKAELGQAVLFRAPVERVFLAPSVDADHRPHPMIMRQQRHLRPPDQIENRQIVRAMQREDPRALRLADIAHQRRRIGDGLVHDLANGPFLVGFLHGLPAIGAKPFNLEHLVKLR